MRRYSLYLFASFFLLLSIFNKLTAGRSSFGIQHKHHGQSIHARSLLQGRDLPIGTCNSATPCVNSACCGTVRIISYLSSVHSYNSNKTNADKDYRTVSADTLPLNAVRETVLRIVMLRQSAESTGLLGRKVVLSMCAVRNLGTSHFARSSKSILTTHE